MKFNKQGQKDLAIWAADCAEHILKYFKKEYPKDDRPRKAIEECRKWAKTSVFKMADIRSASLAAHAAARTAPENSLARFAARAAGQAVATAHAPEHAFGASYYALKVIAADSNNNKEKIIKEYNWQLKRLPENLKAATINWQLKRFPKIFQWLLN
jgi:hypothetical protein